jgi:hypothetical protein
MDVIKEGFSEDAVLHFAGNNAMSGTYRGQEAVMDALGRAYQGWGPHAELESLLASDDHIIAFFHATSERGGKTHHIVQAMPMNVNAEGRITEIWFLANDQREYDQFWT